MVTEKVAAANGCLGMGATGRWVFGVWTAVLRQCGASGRQRISGRPPPASADSCSYLPDRHVTCNGQTAAEEEI